MIIRVEHGWQMGYCSSGMRAFAERHELDWDKFLQEGIEETELAKIDDHMVTKMIEAAHGQQEEAGNRV